jgi:ribose 5-phosphate isomerase B
MNTNIVISIGSDHAGFELKKYLMSFLEKRGNITIIDCGCFNTDSVDYPDIAYRVANSVTDGEANKGILICGSGSGMAITANKVPTIRAVNCFNTEMAALAVQHNNANILCFGARFIAKEYAQEILNSFLTAEFEGGRHQLRIDKII